MSKSNEGLVVIFRPGAASKGPQFRGERRFELTDLMRGERLQIMLTPEELEALDSWRFSNRMPSRAAAVRELLKRGLGGLADAHGESSARRAHSRDYRMLPRRGGNGSGNGANGNGADGNGRQN